MFYHVFGTLEICEPYIAVIDCAGVGYKLITTINTTDELSSKIGEKVKLYTHFAIREDSVDLFGFYTLDELNSFKLLISVSGVGPKAAISILSVLTPDKLAEAVSCEDTRLIAKAPGIGSKTAARVVLELKDKYKNMIFSPKTSTGIPKNTCLPRISEKLSEATDALNVLGYNRTQILDALSGIDTSSLSLEQTITAALKKLAK